MPASDILKAAVKRFKLPQGDETAVFNFLDGKVSDPTTPVTPELVQYYVSQDPTIQQIFDKRFPGNVALRNAGKTEYSYENYLALENELITDIRDAGFPPGFYDDRESIGKFIGGEVSRSEVQLRASAAYTAVREAEPGTVAELKRLYGLNDGDLAAYFLDPTRATDAMKQRLSGRQLVGQVQASQISAQAAQQAGLQLTAQQAEQLGQAGVTQAQARTGFGAIGQEQQLYQPQMVGEQAVTTEEQIGAAFGTNAAAQARIAQRRRRRQAEFQAGGSLATGQTGVIGLRTIGE